MSGRAALHATLLLAVVIAANAATDSLGLVHWLGLTATAGTWLAGLAFVARDSLHDSGGVRAVLAVIALGAVLSAALSPRLALASAVAFAIAELADLAIYSPLRRRSRTGAALASNVVGSVVDTVVFLALAGFPLTGAPAQVVVKVAVTSLFVVGGRLALLRHPQRAQSA